MLSKGQKLKKKIPTSFLGEYRVRSRAQREVGGKVVLGSKGAQSGCIQILISSLNGCVTLAKLLHLPEPLIPHLQIGVVNIVQRFHNVVCVKRLSQPLFYSRQLIIVAVLISGASPSQTYLPKVLPLPNSFLLDLSLDFIHLIHLHYLQLSFVSLLLLCLLLSWAGGQRWLVLLTSCIPSI